MDDPIKKGKRLMRLPFAYHENTDFSATPIYRNDHVLPQRLMTTDGGGSMLLQHNRHHISREQR
jgi:hypothetical protein